jgi:hypothetical protein
VTRRKKNRDGEMRDSHLLGSDVKVEPGRQQVIIDTAG